MPSPARLAVALVALAALGCDRLPLDLGERPDGGEPAQADGGAAAPFVVLDLTLGADFACARLSGGELACWGSDNYGQLGIEWPLRAVQERCGESYCSTRPQRHEHLSRVLDVDAGGAFACALHGAGAVTCWGSNRFGERGDGTGGDVDRHADPSRLPDPALEIAVGRHHVCALDLDRRVRCWGLAEHGQLGRPATERCAVPEGLHAELGVTTNVRDVGCSSIAAPVEGLAGPVDHIVAGDFHTCAMRAGEVLCWGRNDRGQLGDGTVGAPRSVPQPVRAEDGVALGGVRALALGAASAIALHGTTGSARWGDATHGALALPPGDADACTGEARCAPRPLQAEWPLTEVALGRGFGCGVDARRGAYCWGLATEGRLGVAALPASTCRDGDADVPCALEPLGVVSLARDVRAVAVGDAHACALGFADEEGASSVHCWGRNDAGQLGIGTLGEPESVPVAVPRTR